MDIKEALLRDQNFDPYNLYNDLPVPDLVASIEAILKDSQEIEIINENPTYRNNLLNLVHFLYLKVLSEKKPTASPNTTHKQRKGLFTKTSLSILHSLPA